MFSSPLSSAIRRSKQNVRSAENTSSVVQVVLHLISPVEEGVNSVKRDFCSGYNCKTLCCPLVEQRSAVRFLHELCPSVFKRMFTWSSACLLTAVISWKNTEEAGKRTSFCSFDKQKRNHDVCNQLAGWRFFFVSFRSKCVHITMEQDLILYRVLKSHFSVCKKREKLSEITLSLFFKCRSF